MLQVRAGRCPGCKEEAPPGAEYCPICGEYLGWQTTSGQNIPRGKTTIQRRSAKRNIVRTLIFFLAAFLVSFIGFRLFDSPSNSITEMPPIQSTPALTENALTENALTENAAENAASDNSVDNVVSDNSVSDNSVSDNSVSNNASTPDAASPAPRNEMPDLDLQ